MGFTPSFYIDSDASNSANSFGEFEEMWLRIGGEGWKWKACQSGEFKIFCKSYLSLA